MVAIGMNKAAEEFLILDDQTREDLASGKYRDQRRGTFGPTGPTAVAAGGPGADPATTSPANTSPAGRAAANPAAARQRPAASPRAARPRAATPRAATPQRLPWTPSQERLALLYNEQGLRPDEIAAKLGVSSHLATQIVLAARKRRRA